MRSQPLFGDIVKNIDTYETKTSIIQGINWYVFVSFEAVLEVSTRFHKDTFRHVARFEGSLGEGRGSGTVDDFCVQ